MVFNSRWFWFGFGIIPVLTFQLLKYQLQRIRQLSEVREDEEQESVENPDAVDALNLNTLAKLTKGSNFDLRVAALKIICERAYKGPTLDLIIRDLASSDAHSRGQAVSTLRLFMYKGMLASSRLTPRHLFPALVEALAHMIPESANGVPLYPRHSDELSAISLLYWYMPDNVHAAIDAGVVTKWLSQYPFGNSALEKRETIVKMNMFRHPDTLLCGLVNLFIMTPESRKQMRQCGLLGSAVSEEELTNQSSTRGNGSNGNIDRFSMSSNQRSWRRAVEDVEEQRIRRRRREAMVISDGVHPVESEDIIQPNDEIVNIQDEFNRFNDAIEALDALEQTNSRRNTDHLRGPDFPRRMT